MTFQVDQLVTVKSHATHILYNSNGYACSTTHDFTSEGPFLIIATPACPYTHVCPSLCGANEIWGRSIDDPDKYIHVCPWMIALKEV